MSLDTPQRAAAIRGSAEVSAARHLARTYGVSMRRRRTVGAVIFDLGLLTATSVASGSRAYGELRVDDTGRVTDAMLFGTPLAGISLLQLASILEHGPQPEESTTLVLSEAPEALTAPVPLVLDPVTGPIVVTPVLQAPRKRALSGPPRRSVVSVPVRAVTVSQPRRRALSAEDRAAVVRATHPAAWRLWTRFTVGLALILLAMVATFVIAVTPGAPLQPLALCLTTAIAGVIALQSAIHANDARLDALRAAS